MRKFSGRPFKINYDLVNNIINDIEQSISVYNNLDVDNDLSMNFYNDFFSLIETPLYVSTYNFKNYKIEIIIDKLNGKSGLITYLGNRVFQLTIGLEFLDDIYPEINSEDLFKLIAHELTHAIDPSFQMNEKFYNKYMKMKDYYWGSNFEIKANISEVISEIYFNYISGYDFDELKEILNDNESIHDFILSLSKVESFLENISNFIKNDSIKNKTKKYFLSSIYTYLKEVKSILDLDISDDEKYIKITQLGRGEIFDEKFWKRQDLFEEQDKSNEQKKFSYVNLLKKVSDILKESNHNKYAKKIDLHIRYLKQI